MSQTPKSPRGYAIAAIAALVGLSAWVMLSSDWAHPYTPTDADPSSAADPSTHSPEIAVVDPADLQAHKPIERTHSPLVQAEVTVLLSAYRWVHFPEAVKIELLPQGTNPHAKRHLWTKSGGKMVQFLNVGFGSWVVQVQSNGFQTVVVPLAVSESNPHPRQTIPLRPSRRIEGRVMDQAGHPVPLIRVSARLQTPIPGFTVNQATSQTDQEGRYTIDGLPEGSYYVFPGEIRSPLGPLVATDLIGELAFADLTVPVLSSATIVVKDQSTGQLLPDMRVQAMRATADGMPGHTAFRQSDEQGASHFDHLPAGEYIFTVFGSGYKSKTQHVVVEADGSGTVEIEILPLERNS
jgi:carboxypeptidase family protein